MRLNQLKPGHYYRTVSGGRENYMYLLKIRGREKVFFPYETAVTAHFKYGHKPTVYKNMEFNIRLDCWVEAPALEGMVNLWL